MAQAFATTLRPRWSFTGCGLLGGYYLGAWHALSRPNVPSALFDASASSFSGASAGALVSTAIASGCSHESTTRAFERIAERVRAAGLLRCDLLALVRTEAEALLPEDAHERSRGRLSVLATDCKGAPPFLRPVLLESFDSRASLIDALLVSSYLPGIMSAPRLSTELRQRTLVDGGLWSVAPPDGQRHLSASPFGGAFDVSPSSHTGRPAGWPTVRVGMGWIDASPANLRAAWHAAHPVAELESLYRAGFDDACRFVRSECPGLMSAPYAVRPE